MGVDGTSLGCCFENDLLISWLNLNVLVSVAWLSLKDDGHQIWTWMITM